MSENEVKRGRPKKTKPAPTITDNATTNAFLPTAATADIANLICAIEQRLNQLEHKAAKAATPQRPAAATAAATAPPAAAAGVSPSQAGLAAVLGEDGLLDSELFDIGDIEQQQLNSAGKGSSLKLKSGYELKVQEPIKCQQLWPHGFLSKIRSHTNTDPDHLEMEAFMYGYTYIMIHLLKKGEVIELEGRLKHLLQVTWHSINHRWKSALDFHYDVLRELEAGHISWEDTQAMNMLSLSAIQGKHGLTKPAPANPASSKQVKASPSRRSICCKLFNTNEDGCHFEKSGACKKLHACSICEEKGFFNKHRALDCTKQ